MGNTPGDTPLDEVVTPMGLTGTSLLVSSDVVGKGTHELRYGLVFDTVG